MSSAKRQRGAADSLGRDDTTSAKKNHHQIPVSLGKPSLRLRLEAYYSLIAPDLIANPEQWRKRYDQVYEKFGGSYEGERKLAAKLANKYGTAVRLLLAESALKDSGYKEQTPSDESIAKNPEEWYRLRLNEVNSGDVNLTSENFDPLQALTCSLDQVIKNNGNWLRECPLLDTVHKFAVHLPVEDPLRREPPTASRKRPATNPEQQASTKKAKPPSLSPLAAVAEPYQTGPLSVLYKLMKKRVRVVIRYVNGIRGTVTGTLLSFDKHMNLLLKDVTEVYTPRENTQAMDNQPTNTELEVTRRLRAYRECGQSTNYWDPQKEDENQMQLPVWAVRERQMKQMLVRGDSVVIAYSAEEERSYRSGSISSKGSPRSPSSRYRKGVVEVPRNERLGTPGSLGDALRQKARWKARK